MKLLHIDCDVTGSTSIRHLVPQWIESYRAPTSRDVAGILKAVKDGQLQCDAVAIDTVTSLADTVREDMDLDPDKRANVNVWEYRDKLKSTRDTYYSAGRLVNSIWRQIRELPIPTILVAHEKHTGKMEGRSDPLSHADKYVPNLQDSITQSLFNFADSIVRICPAPVSFEFEGVKYPQYSRVLVLSANSDSAAGTRVPGDIASPPPIMVVPDNDPYAFKRFAQAIGGVPHTLLLYGPPKIGKTRFLSGIVYMEK